MCLRPARLHAPSLWQSAQGRNDERFPPCADPLLSSPRLPLPLPLPSPSDRLLDTGNQEVIMKMFRRFPKAGAGVARLQVGRALLAIPAES